MKILFCCVQGQSHKVTKIQTQKGSNERLFILTRTHSMHIFCFRFSFKFQLLLVRTMSPNLFNQTCLFLLNGICFIQGLPKHLFLYTFRVQISLEAENSLPKRE